MDTPADDGPADTADGVIERLAGEAELVDRGQFTIDLERAGEKLEAYRVAEPALWIVLVVEAATLLGADSVRVYYAQRRSILVRILGAALEPEELRQLDVSTGLARAGEGEVDERRREAIERFATVLSLLRAREVHSLVLDTYGTTASSLSWQGSDAPAKLSEPARGSAGSGMYLEAAFWEWHLDRSFNSERELLLARCGYARIDVRLDEQPIVHDLCGPLQASKTRWVPRPAPLLLDGELLGYHGFEHDRLRGSRLWLLIHGVLVETIELPAEGEVDNGAGYLAIVDSSALRRDLSLSKLVRDQAFEQVLATVEAARRSWLDKHAYAIQSRTAALMPQPTPEVEQAKTHANIVAGGGSAAWLGFWLWLWGETELAVFGWIGFVGLVFVTALLFGKAYSVKSRQLAAKAGEREQ